MENRRSFCKKLIGLATAFVSGCISVTTKSGDGDMTKELKQGVGDVDAAELWDSKDNNHFADMAVRHSSEELDAMAEEMFASGTQRLS